MIEYMWDGIERIEICGRESKGSKYVGENRKDRILCGESKGSKYVGGNRKVRVGS